MLMLKYLDTKTELERDKQEKSRKVEGHASLSAMASVGLFFEGPSILAKTAMAAVNPVSGGPSTIFSSPGQCWHFNYCWVNSFAPMKAVRPNRICRLPDLWTHVTQDTIGARPKLSLPSPYYSLLLQLLIPRWVRLWKNTREGEKKRRKHNCRTPQLNTFLSPRQVLTDLKGTPSDIIAVKGQCLSLA